MNALRDSPVLAFPCLPSHAPLPVRSARHCCSRCSNRPSNACPSNSTPRKHTVFAPGLLYLLISALGVKGAIGHIVLCAAVQLAVGFPFLAYHPMSYIAGSFNLGRVFMHRWSVNLKFLPEVRAPKAPTSAASPAHRAISARTISSTVFLTRHRRSSNSLNNRTAKMPGDFCLKVPRHHAAPLARILPRHLLHPPPPAQDGLAAQARGSKGVARLHMQSPRGCKFCRRRLLPDHALSVLYMVNPPTQPQTPHSSLPHPCLLHGLGVGSSQGESDLVGTWLLSI